MRELTIGKNDAGQRLDRFVAKNLPLLPPALLQKYIRLKRVKVNGKGSKRDARLQAGDILQLYINDEFFDKPKEENLFLSIFQPRLSVVYEDETKTSICTTPPATSASASAWQSLAMRKSWRMPSSFFPCSFPRKARPPLSQKKPLVCWGL